MCGYRHEWRLYVATFHSCGIENVFALPRAWGVEAMVPQIAITGRLRHPGWRAGLVLGYRFHRCGQERVQAATKQRTNIMSLNGMYMLGGRSVVEDDIGSPTTSNMSCLHWEPLKVQPWIHVNIDIR